MNNKPNNLYFNILRLILRAYNAKEKGFVVGIVMGFCLVAVVVGLAMVLAAGDDKVHSLSETKQEKSFDVAETGIIRVMSLLQKRGDLAGDDDWTDTVGGGGGGSFLDCAGDTISGAGGGVTLSAAEVQLKSDIESNASTWINSSNAEQGEFQVIDYTPDVGASEATLTVVGRATANTNNPENNGVTRLKVTFPLTTSTTSSLPFPFPGLWATDNITAPDPLQLANINTINANVRQSCSDPDTSSGKADPNALTASGTPGTGLLYDGSTPTLERINVRQPDLPEPPHSPRETSSGALSNTGGVSGGPIVNTPVLPPIAQLLDHNCVIELPRTGASNTTCNVQHTTFPNFQSYFNGITDTPDSKGRYHYIISTVGNTVTNGDSIDVGNGFRLNIQPGTTVVLYARGKIKVQGSYNEGSTSGSKNIYCGDNPSNGLDTYTDTALNPISTLASEPYAPPVGATTDADAAKNLQIYVADGNGAGTNWGGAYSASDIYISQSLVTGFVYAPATLVNLSQGSIQGALWAKKVQTSNSSACGLGVAQAALDSSMLMVLEDKVVPTYDIGAITAWEKLEATDTVASTPDPVPVMTNIQSQGTNGVSLKRAQLTWDPLTDAVSYKVDRCNFWTPTGSCTPDPNGVNDANVQYSTLDAGSVTTYPDNSVSLNNGDSMCYAIRGIDSSNDSSPASNIKCMHNDGGTISFSP